MRPGEADKNNTQTGYAQTAHHVQVQNQKTHVNTRSPLKYNPDRTALEKCTHLHDDTQALSTHSLLLLIIFYLF